MLTPAPQSPQDIIDSAISLPEDQRLAVMDAIHVSLANQSLDHGTAENFTVVQDAWKDEIAQRIADIDAGRVQTIPAEEAERMIRSDSRPAV